MISCMNFLETVIPRHLFQTWETSVIPLQWEDGPKSFKRIHPQWKYTLFDHQDRKDFIRQFFPDLSPIFNRFPHLIQQADVIRYAYLYLHGGVYADLKNVFVQPLDHLFAQNPKQDLFIAQSPNSGCISNYFLASRPKHPLWLECIRLVIDRSSRPLPFYIIGRYLTVYYTTGPWIVEAAAKKLFLKTTDFLLSADFQPCTVCDESRCGRRGQTQSTTTYLLALSGRSWNTWDSHFMNWMFCNRKVLFFVLLLCIILTMRKRLM